MRRKILTFVRIYRIAMILNKKHGYLIQWLIGVGDLIVLNLLFMAVFHLLGPKYTEAISYNLREVILLLNFCYFFSLYFIPIQLHQAVVFIDKIVQRAFGLVTVLIYLLDLLECGRCSGNLPLGLLRGFYHLVFALAGFGAPIFKVVQAKRL